MAKAAAVKAASAPASVPSWATAKIEAHGGADDEVRIELEHISTPAGDYEHLTIDLANCDTPGTGYENRHEFTLNEVDAATIDAIIAALTSLRLAQMARGVR